MNCRKAADRAAAQVSSFLAKSPPRPAQNAKRCLELYGPLKTVGRDTYTNDLLELAGGHHVAADAKGTVQFSAERLVQADPEIILVVGTASDRAVLASRPAMAELKAVHTGRVFVLDRYWLVPAHGCRKPWKGFAISFPNRQPHRGVDMPFLRSTITPSTASPRSHNFGWHVPLRHVQLQAPEFAAEAARDRSTRGRGGFSPWSK